MAPVWIGRTPAALVSSACLALVAGCAMIPPRSNTAELQRQVADTERAFAKTMADRNHEAFVSFLAEEAIFFTNTAALRGRQEVADFWTRFYDKPDAPFSWKPEKVEVLESGTLALSTGPVFDPAGKNFATYTSIWRLEAPGVWRIVFDKGNDVCDCPKVP
jgi:ketosteroid isomerase-like protein